MSLDAPISKALLYSRVSTAMQVEDGVSLDAQERQLITAAEFHGFNDWELVREEGRSGKSIKGRPKLQETLKVLEQKDADALIVTRLDRLARSTTDFLQIVDKSAKEGWRLILLDLNLDTSTYQGRFVTTVMSALAEMERGIIAERAKDIHKDRRAQGIEWGKDIGPKADDRQDLIDAIIKYRSKGLSFKKIADKLNLEGYPTKNGGLWYATTVQNVWKRNQ
jgi:DNA invertase Pin-like site-specific DNA recombinase